MKEYKPKISRIKPKHVFLFALGYFLIFSLASILIDAADIFGMQKSVVKWLPSTFLWHAMFREESPTQIINWVFLAGICMFSGIAMGKLTDKGSEKAYKYYKFLSLGVLVLILEEIGDIIGSLVKYAEAVFIGVDNISEYTQTVFYGVAVLLIIYGVLRYGKHIWKWKQARLYSIAGFMLYIGKTAFTMMRDRGSWYRETGELIHKEVLGGDMAVHFSNPVSYEIMDFWIGNSIELLASAALLSSVIAAIRYIDRETAESID